MLEEKTEVRLSIRHNWNTAKLKDLLFLVKSVLFGFDDAGTVAEWSKALLLRGKINEKPKRSQVRPPAWATFLKKTPNIFGGCIALR